MKYSFTIGAVALMISLSLTQPSDAFELKGKYKKGSYKLGANRIVFFAISYKGKLTTNSVRKEVALVYRHLADANKTGYQYRTNSTHRHSDRYPLKRGEVFVFGYFNLTTNTNSWIAADRNEAAFPKHRWLNSLKKTGQIDSSQASVNPTKAAAITSFQTGGRVMRLELFSSSGWLAWFFN